MSNSNIRLHECEICNRRHRGYYDREGEFIWTGDNYSRSQRMCKVHSREPADPCTGTCRRCRGESER